MKIVLEDSDSPHILDLNLRVGNPIYTGCQIQQIPQERRYGSQEFELVGTQDHLGSLVWNNCIARLRTMPSDFLIVTGVTPNWIRSQVHMLAQDACSVVFTNDGKNTILLPKAPPASRAGILV